MGKADKDFGSPCQKQPPVERCNSAGKTRVAGNSAGLFHHRAAGALGVWDVVPDKRLVASRSELISRSSSQAGSIFRRVCRYVLPIRPGTVCPGVQVVTHAPVIS